MTKHNEPVDPHVTIFIAMGCGQFAPRLAWAWTGRFGFGNIVIECQNMTYWPYQYGFPTSASGRLGNSVHNATLPGIESVAIS